MSVVCSQLSSLTLAVTFMSRLFSDFVTIFVPFIMPPFKEDGVYCCANVCRLVDHMVFADYLENHLSQSLNISHVDWS